MCQGLGAREGVETRYSPLSHSSLDGDVHTATAFIDTRTIIFSGRVGRLLQKVSLRHEAALAGRLPSRHHAIPLESQGLYLVERCADVGRVSV
jgi:hypothetical protein